MPDIPPEALEAVDTALDSLPQPDSPFERDRWRIVSRVAVNAAAPILADAVAAKILAHMEEFAPPKPRGVALEAVIGVGRDYRAWRQHFGIAARVAASAFTTEEEAHQAVAEALERGDFMECRSLREDGDRDH